VLLDGCFVLTVEAGVLFLEVDEVDILVDPRVELLFFREHALLQQRLRRVSGDRRGSSLDSLSCRTSDLLHFAFPDVQSIIVASDFLLDLFVGVDIILISIRCQKIFL